MKSTVVWIFIALYLHSEGDALTCYKCLYFDGHNQSDPNCLNNLSSTLAVSCDNTTSTMGVMEYKPRGSQIEQKACMYAKGVLDNKTLIMRGCGTGHYTHNNNCFLKIKFPLEEAKDAKDTVICSCPGNICNDLEPYVKNGSSSNGLSTVRFTFLSLLLIGIRFMYTFTSGNY